MSNVLTKEYFDKHLKQEFAKRDKILEKRFNAVDKRFELVDKRFEEQKGEFEKRVGAICESFQHGVQMLAENLMGLHHKVDKIDKRVENLESDMKYLKTTLAVAEII